MADQAEALRQLVLQTSRERDESPRRGSLTMVVGAAPQVGATTVASCLAVSLKQWGWSVALIEGNRHAARLARHWRLKQELYLQEVVRRRRTLREVLSHGPCGLQWTGWSIPSTSEAVADEFTVDEALVDQLVLLSNSQHIVLEVGTDSGWDALIEHASDVLVVAEADTESATHAYARIKDFSGHLKAARCWTVANRVEQSAHATLMLQRLELTCERFLNLCVLPAGHLAIDAIAAELDGIGHSAMLGDTTTPFSRDVQAIVGRIWPQMRPTARGHHNKRVELTSAQHVVRRSHSTPMIVAQ